ncbi:MAG: SdrD B-like domain-containing protein [Desulfobulbaceae bacterium]
MPGGNASVNLTYLHKATICGVLKDASGRAWGNLVIFLDLNNNGAYDPGEPTAETDPAGIYCFAELFPGTYTLLLTNQLPAGYELLLAPGTVTVGAGEDSTANFVTYQPVDISGLVWDDAGGNGVREPAEEGLAGITVFLDTNNNGLLDGGELSTLTDTTGAYAFTGLQQGEFYVRADDSTLLEAYIRTTPANPVHLVLGPGQSDNGARFGYQKKLAPMHTLQDPTRFAWGSDNNLYVSDNANNAVFIYDSAQNIIGELKKLARPLGVATDVSGNIYVGNQGRKNVEVYDALGNLLRTIGAGSIVMPNDLALDRDHNLYILDSANDTVLVYDQAGRLTSTIGDSSRMGYAMSMAISYHGEAGELYVADQTKGTIHVFALDGSYKKSIGTLGSLYTTNWNGKFSALVAVSVDGYGNIHGLDNNLNVVQVFEPRNGTFLRSYNAYPAENEYRLNLQTDINIHPADNLVMVSNLATRSVETVTTITAP